MSATRTKTPEKTPEKAPAKATTPLAKTASHDVKAKAHAPGLTAAEVAASREKHGPNILTPPPKASAWEMFLEKFDDPIIRILMVAAGLAIAVGIFDGHWIEGLGIIIAILLATGLAFLNEYKANNAFEILNKTNDLTPIKVRREGAFTQVAKQDIVVGDLVLVENGEEIPADGRLLEAVSLQVDQAALTGESLPVEKHAATEDGTPEGETEEGSYRVDHLYRGTFVADGHGLMEVTAVGDKTQLGQTARAAADVENEEETPLNIQLEKLSKVIGVVGFGVAAVVMMALFSRDLMTGELVLAGNQWAAAFALGLGMFAALTPIWLPIAYDAIELSGREAEPPAWLEENSVWWKSAAVGAGLALIGLLGAMLFGGLPLNPTTWLTQAAISEFLAIFMIALTLIVVAVPEGLAMAVTLSLAYSMHKMAAENNLVRKMHACETIGAATVICSDKTGTLTQNRMTVQELVRADGKTGTAAFDSVLREAIAANSTGNLDLSKPDKPAVVGNPTEGALLLALHRAGIDYVAAREAFDIERQWTFNTERKFMATLGKGEDDKRRLHVKGAPEIVLSRCVGAMGGGDFKASSDEILAGLKAAQRRGMRTIGLAYREVAADETVAPEAVDAAQGLTWIGFAAVEDPIRPEVPQAVLDCARAGVKVKMVTGDIAETAKEIGRQIGLLTDADGEAAHMTGPAFAALNDEAAKLALRDIKILSRARPMDKMRMVRLLQEDGEVVAVTGDGTNDAPALNKANVGLAMGSGTSVAKAASDIVLLDDSFGSIAKAILWGRSLYENIQRFILFQLTINVAALGIAMLGPFIGVKLPLTVVQMLWINLIMDTFAALALATEPPNPAVMDRPPRAESSFIVSGPMAREIFGAGLAFIAIMVGMLLWLGDGIDPRIPTWGGTVVFSVFVMLQFWNLFNARALGKTEPAFLAPFANPSFSLIAVGIFVGTMLMVQFGGTFFRTVALGFVDWSFIITLTSLVLWIGEERRFIALARAKH